MLKALPFTTLLASLLLTFPLAFAESDRPDHFKGLPANTLEQAINNLNEYNQQLQAILSGELTPEKMGEIHVLSYTLENALKKIDKEVDQLKDVLEEVHEGSEHMEIAKVKEQGNLYLNTSDLLFKAN